MTLDKVGMDFGRDSLNAPYKSGGERDKGQAVALAYLVACGAPETIGRVFAEKWVSRLKATDAAAAISKNTAATRSENSSLAGGTPRTERGSYSFARFHDHPNGHAVTQVDCYAIGSAVGKSKRGSDLQSGIHWNRK